MGGDTRYGHFDDEAREYVITRPDTPWPWINYLGTGDFFSIISNAAGGYSFYRDARLRRITRYRYNAVPPDQEGRLFYIREAGAAGDGPGAGGGEAWNPGGRPSSTPLDSYECRHGMGYTRIRSSRGGVEAEILFFVPVDSDCEVQQVTLRNLGSREKRISLFSFTEFCLWNALDDMTNFQRNLSTGEVLAENGMVCHLTEYRERRDHFAFYAVNTPPAAMETSREAFTGRYGGYGRPESVARGKLAGTVRGLQSEGWYPCAAFQHDLTLPPGESRQLVFILGYAENPPDEKWQAPGIPNISRAAQMRSRFDSGEKVQAAFAALRAHWEDLLGRFTLESGDARLDRMVNTWNQYQCMVTFLMARSASLFESGIGRGIGFRDTSQDLLGCMHQVPSRARQRLFAVASTQRPDGGAWHQYQPLTRRGNADVGDGFNDDPLWLILGVSSYLKETGDWAFLLEPVPFDNDPGDVAPLFEHLQRSFDHVVNNLGPHGLPLIGHADWNDCLNLNCFSTDPNESFQVSTSRDGRTAESVLIAGMFLVIGRDFAEICRRTGRGAQARAAEQAMEAMREAVVRHGWDGEWYLRAYDDTGRKVGSRECGEGRIFIEPNGFCAIAGIGAEQDLPRRALDSVREHLATPHGIVLLDPPYGRYHVELGEISSYPPGYKENAGVFCHANPWIMIAECVAGRAERAFDYYRRIGPAWREDQQDLHRMEPYVYSQMIAGKASRRHGEAKNSWLTGTAAWNFVAVSQWMLGVRPDFDGLRIQPCLPRDFSSVQVTRRFRGCTYRIRIRNTGRPASEQRVLINGAPSPASVVPPGPAGSELDILVEA